MNRIALFACVFLFLLTPIVLAESQAQTSKSTQTGETSTSWALLVAAGGGIAGTVKFFIDLLKLRGEAKKVLAAEPSPIVKPTTGAHSVRI